MEPIQSDMPFAVGWSAEKFKEFLCIVNSKYYDQIIEVYEELSVIIMEEEKDDDQTIQYRKEMEEGCPEGYTTIWNSYGFSYEKMEE